MNVFEKIVFKIAAALESVVGRIDAAARWSGAKVADIWKDRGRLGVGGSRLGRRWKSRTDGKG